LKIKEEGVVLIRVTVPLDADESTKFILISTDYINLSREALQSNIRQG
jgi:hypothetical protein